MNKKQRAAEKRRQSQEAEERAKKLANAAPAEAAPAAAAQPAPTLTLDEALFALAALQQQLALQQQQMETERQKWNVSLSVMNAQLHTVLEELAALKKQKGAPGKKGEVNEYQARLARRLNLMLFNVPKDITLEQLWAQLVQAEPTVGAMADNAVKLVALPAKEGAAKQDYKLLCNSMEVRTALLRAQNKLWKATSYRLDVDLTPAQQASRKAQKPVAVRVKAAGGFWFFKGAALRVRIAPGEDEDATTWLAKQGGGSATPGTA
jgi:hypothetical protein